MKLQAGAEYADGSGRKSTGKPSPTSFHVTYIPIKEYIKPNVRAAVFHKISARRARPFYAWKVFGTFLTAAVRRGKTICFLGVTSGQSSRRMLPSITIALSRISSAMLPPLTMTTTVSFVFAFPARRRAAVDAAPAGSLSICSSTERQRIA